MPPSRGSLAAAAGDLVRSRSQSGSPQASRQPTGISLIPTALRSWSQHPLLRPLTAFCTRLESIPVVVGRYPSWVGRFQLGPPGSNRIGPPQAISHLPPRTRCPHRERPNQKPFGSPKSPHSPPGGGNPTPEAMQPKAFPPSSQIEHKWEGFQARPSPRHHPV